MSESRIRTAVRLSAIDRRQARLAIELAGFALGFPLAVSYLRGSVQLSFFVLLVPVVAAAAVVIAFDGEFSLRRELARGAKPRDLISVAVTFAIASAGLIGWMLFVAPERLFAMPRQQTGAWLAIVLAYPILSVVPQELVFRSFFFHRYRSLLPAPPWIAVALNGLVFGFAHIVYLSAVSVLLAGGLGVLLAYRYVRTRSLWLVCLEHALYGELVFTVALGHYFLLDPPH